MPWKIVLMSSSWFCKRLWLFAQQKVNCYNDSSLFFVLKEKMKTFFTKYFSYNQEKYENILDDPNNIFWVWLSNFITFLVILFAWVFVFESIGNNEVTYIRELFIFDAFISSVFALEYTYRLFRAHDKVKFMASPMRIIDLFSFVPFFFWLLSAWGVLKLLRLLRVLRVLRLLKRIPLTSWFIKSLRDYMDEYKAVMILFLIILFIGSSFVYYFEKDIIGTHFNSMPMTLWWGLVTMTTVWFWDMYPMTDMGRLLWSTLVFLWPLVMGLFSAVTIMVFMETSKNHQFNHQHHIRITHCHRCKSRNPREANYCMRCGEGLNLK